MEILNPRRVLAPVGYSLQTLRWNDDDTKRNLLFVVRKYNFTENSYLQYAGNHHCDIFNLLVSFS